MARLKPKLNTERINPIDRWNAVQAMRNTTGWKIFRVELSKIADDELMPELLSINDKIVEPGIMYTKRDLIAHQLHLLGKVAKIPIALEEEAKVEKHESKDKGKG